MAAKGLSKAEMPAASRKGGIIGLIFICAFVAQEGQSLISSLPGKKFDPWVVDYEDGQLGVRNAKNIFYNDVSPQLASQAIIRLKNQSQNALETPSGPPAWSDSFYNGRRAYVVCTEDQAVPPIGQQLMIQHSGVKWDVANIPTGHSPFLSQPGSLAAYIVAEVVKFQGGALNPNQMLSISNTTEIPLGSAESSEPASLPTAAAELSLALFSTVAVPSNLAAESGVASFFTGTELSNLTALLDLPADS
ncbi:hypothetical protein OEA41_003738 [Lepraria neglecta]|uniref:Uncharacterized protein n=1 Tax=Lepraria neglecta TaxID=209136 RepID=A0AAE0DJ66_9LECA|nr:hypothetical protein OEA41_003738 [Lepraria neglecta]